MDSFSKSWLEKKHVGYTLCHISHSPAIKQLLYVHCPGTGAKLKRTIEREMTSPSNFSACSSPPLTKKYMPAKRERERGETD